MPATTTICFIINPISGAVKKQHLPAVFKKAFTTDEFHWEIKFTKAQKHATELAAAAVAEKFDIVVAVGGDGTINEVAQSLVGTEAALGIIPLGSGNGLARHLGIPLHVEQALQVILHGSTRRIDSCQVNGEAFFCTSGVGFDATVSHFFAQHQHKRGLFNYARAALRQYFSYRPQQYKIEIDGQQLTKQAFIIVVANAAQYGNNVYVSPEAGIADGQLDVCIIKHFAKWRGPLLLAQSFGRRIHRSRYVEVLRGRQVRISSASRLLHVDGDPLELKQPLHYAIDKQALKVRVPG
jgi:YegS/Rv2252/BmrU family lipid kinase